MLFLHDVWVNWFEGEENGYNVCHFHEWRKEDTVELLDQTPLLRVPSVLFHYIENDLSELPKELLDQVHQKSYVRKNHERTKLEYCFVVTDGIGIIAVDTIGYTIPVRKSRLIPRQEQLVYEMVKDVEPESFQFEPSQLESSKEYHILSLAPEHVRGLTRKERQVKQLMFMALDQLKGLKNRAEIVYWYTEWNPHMYEQIKRMSFEEIWDMLYNETIEGWSDKHLAFCENLIKGQPFFEKLWEMEQESKVN
ncbi:YjbA family protein [Bacillus velezensis]|uniref:YjbA family protein n=1 Tax=Bacillus velezensis TaxID=492670 RepID=UPI003BF5A129